MTDWWPVALLTVLVTSIFIASRRARFQPLFRWLPVPLWCYLLPPVLASVGVLPHMHPSYRELIHNVLPFALALLLLGVDLSAMTKIGWPLLTATGLGALSIVLGTPLMAWLLRPLLPAEAWKGVGTLAATWTGGSMNLLALRTLLETPEPIFTSLILVDATIAYSWMALLMWISTVEVPINRWLRAQPLECAAALPSASMSPTTLGRGTHGSHILCAVILTVGARLVAPWLPTTTLVNSANGWIVLLVTTSALLVSSGAPLRRWMVTDSPLGHLGLYLVLAALGVQASLSALHSAAVWMLLGAGVALLHGLWMLLSGRLLRLPLGVLATASQANLGGVVSTPLVASVYGRSLAPAGLLLAIGCNALGTYLGLLSATLGHWLLRA